jgi:biotin transport system substrate-specific component
MRMATRDLVLMALFAAVMAALGLLPKVPLPLGGVPITAQSMGVMLAGAILGRVRGAGAMAIFVALVALGLPLLAGGRGGLGVFAGPSGGFIVGFILGAYLTGLMAERLALRFVFPRFLLASIIGGIGGVYLLGIPHWVLISGSSVGEVLLISLNFIPGDLIKAGIAALVAAAVYRGYPVLTRA